jgi:hypothetical protein
MGIGTIDNELGVREGWVRDEDNEISLDGYNAFVQITTNDGTSGFAVKDSTGADVFKAKSDGDVIVTKNLGVQNQDPQEAVDVSGKIKTEQIQITDGAVEGYVLTSDSEGNATWEDAYAAGGGIDAYEHRALDQLVHNLAENSFIEVIYSGNKVDSVIAWTDSGKTIKIREEQFVYDGNKIIQAITIQYNAFGVEVERLTEDFTYVANTVVSVTTTLT